MTDLDVKSDRYIRLLKQLLFLFLKKSDRNDVSNYQGISLLSVRIKFSHLLSNND